MGACLYIRTVGLRKDGSLASTKQDWTASTTGGAPPHHKLRRAGVPLAWRRRQSVVLPSSPLDSKRSKEVRVRPGIRCFCPPSSKCFCWWWLTPAENPSPRPKPDAKNSTAELAPAVRLVLLHSGRVRTSAGSLEVRHSQTKGSKQPRPIELAGTCISRPRPTGDHRNATPNQRQRSHSTPVYRRTCAEAIAPGCGSQANGDVY